MNEITQKVHELLRKYMEFRIVFWKHYATRKKILLQSAVTVRTNINSALKSLLYSESLFDIEYNLTKSSSDLWLSER